MSQYYYYPQHTGLIALAEVSGETEMASLDPLTADQDTVGSEAREEGLEYLQVRVKLSPDHT